MNKPKNVKRELLLLRHGKSDWNIPASNLERPLKKRGQEGAKVIGRYLKDNNLYPDYIICSPAKRARETAELVCAELSIAYGKIIQEDSIYKASFMSLIMLIQSCPAQAKRILIVGHNPGLEDLIFYLPKTEVEMPEDDKLFPTSALAIFKHESDWSDIEVGAVGELSIIRPKGQKSQGASDLLAYG